jgi:DNA adenine methylase
MSCRDAAQKWNISQRRVSVLCAENRIPNVAILGNMWIIPIDAEKPTDARKNNGVKSTEKVHPFIKWAGGKAQLLDVLKSNLPNGIGTTIKKYAEPFVGGGALLFSMLEEYSFEEIYISDNNKELMNTYIAIRDNHSELLDALNTLQNEYNGLSIELQEQFYYEKREEFNTVELTDETSVQKASLFIFLNKSCFNGLFRVNKKGKYNVPFGKHKSVSICDTDNLTKISHMLQNVIIKSCDYQEVMSFADSSTLVYFDPPYRPLNVTSGFTSYTEDDFSDKNQIELAECFKALSNKGVKVMLSNSDPKNANENDNFFDDLFAEFNILRVSASRMINSKGSSRGKIKELLIKNY